MQLNKLKIISSLNFAEPPPSGTINPPTIRVFQSSSVAVGESFGINCSTVQDVRAYFSVHLAGPALAVRIEKCQYAKVYILLGVLSTYHQ